ncbi:hypothetical protein IEQ34_013648 [Dendrobium chrysotoxum]|uniref:Uncharacterized protein n=1 Tax=Dendrobium chrysotoxum TaxID=161865 RepID=A0AAV7GRG8_DENCH|nr:hypothetical protein IEQ34_013648 [Dendrobium chrysotoxum]
MVLQRRLDYRVNGYHFPSFPHVPLSAKGKRSVRKRNLGNRMCAFDLLAAVAGKLLDKDNSSAICDVPSSISDSKQEIFNELKTCNDEFSVQDSHPKASKVASSGFILEQKTSSWKEHSMTLKLLENSLVSLCSGSSNEDVMGERGSSISGEVGIEPNIAGNFKATHSLERRVYEAVTDGNPSSCYNLDGSVESDAKPPLIRCESSMKVHISRDNDPYSSSFPHSWDGLELPVNSDDDENSSRCADPCTTTIKSSKPHFGEHRLRKHLASRCWKVDLGDAKHSELSKSDLHLKPAFRSRKISYTRQRTRRISFKRKLFDGYSVTASHKGLNRAGVLNLFKKKEILEGSNSAALHGVNGIRSNIAEQLSSHKPEDFHVKLSIKSFIVPELFIEIPETATVGSLKRTVMEAITAIIGSGLHVGVLLQGKNVRDDDRTLIQAGISHANELDELSFTLEPNSGFAPSRYSNTGKPYFFLPCDSTEALTMLQAGPSLDQGKSDSSSCHALTSTIICHESNRNSVHSLLEAPLVDKIASSQALSANPATSVEALSVVPVDKPRRSELVQRRIRRPFTVSEVEALVMAVEKLGTGRWRDVKIQSFDNAKHRTYVDLKDKWKTLVHTARISPQHRRGEPVPQELLDRVLLAHSYWSQQQAKLQAKTPSAEACLGLLSEVTIN